MCLYIDNDLHPINKHRIAERDIVVYKALDAIHETGGISPYMRATWLFGEQKIVRIGKAKTRKGCDNDIYLIHKGLHSCNTKLKARCHGLPDNLCPAIIPKGSKLFFGTNGDIVSNALIVYKNMKELEAVHGKVAKPIKKNLIAV